MKNPLRKRIPRELKGEFGKYLVVFILMVTTIGMVSGGQTYPVSWLQMAV